VLRTPAYHSGVVAFTEGWDTADVEITCSGNCSCAPLTIHAYKERLRVMAYASFVFRDNVRGQLCDMLFRARTDSEGHRGFKLLAIIHDGSGPDGPQDASLAFNGDSFGVHSAHNIIS
jgi:hypothetical protein